MFGTTIAQPAAIGAITARAVSNRDARHPG